VINRTIYGVPHHGPADADSVEHGVRVAFFNSLRVGEGTDESRSSLMASQQNQPRWPSS